MGNCCASGAREGNFDQKEDKLTSPELKKEEEPIEERKGRPAAAPEPQENPDDIMFRNTLRSIKSHNDKTNVNSIL